MLRSLRWLIVVATFLIISLIVVQPIAAASFIVTKTADTNDGVCNADCSLREAITAANAAGGTDTITFDPVVFNPGTITISSPLPAITQALNITGLGAALTIIDGDSTYRVFEITGASTAITDLTVTGGFTDGDGGAINIIGGGLTLTNIQVTNSFASGAGGGIYARAGMTITNSIISDNSSVGEGGGIRFVDQTAFNSTPLTITGSSFINNVTANNAYGGGLAIGNGNINISDTLFQDNASGSGGGISLINGILMLSRSTFIGNDALTIAGGGGMDLRPLLAFDQQAVIRDSTFSGNTTVGSGGGLSVSGDEVIIFNSTFSGNTANSGGGLVNGSSITLVNSTIASNSAVVGSGIYASFGLINLQNSIVANNSGGTNCGKNTGFGVITDNGNNIDSGTSCAFGGTVGQNTNPNLGALANNGGPTRTMLPLAGSPAINAGSNIKAVDHLGVALTLDQRLTGYPRIIDTTVDIGAVEVGCPPFPYTVQASDIFGLTNAIACANSSVANSVINLTDSTYTLSAAYSGVNGLPPIITTAAAGTLTINGNGATIARSNRGGVPSFRIFQINSGGNLSLNSLTVSNGRVESGSGGAIENNGTLNLTFVTVRGSRASFSGGGVSNTGTATIIGSTLSSNISDKFGGGIANANGTLYLINTTLANNSATGISGVDGGGALDSYTGNPSVYIINSTIAGNSAAQTARSGIWIEAGTLTIQNSILANNGGANNCVVTGGSFTDAGNNLDSGVTCPLGGTSLSNANANLGALADNGGETQTMALLIGSGAINTGSNALAVNHAGAALTTDQRGSGFPRINNTTVDIGAFESNTSSLGVTVTMQGRSTPKPHSSYVANIRVTIMPVGGGAVIYNQMFVTTQNGTFTIPNLPLGTYLFRFKGTHTLAEQHVITIVAGTNNQTTDMLLEGDANDDNAVTLPDFSLLAASFGRAQGQTGYDARADFNQDTIVNLTDFSLLASNFNKAGDGGVNP